MTRRSPESSSSKSKEIIRRATAAGLIGLGALGLAACGGEKEGTITAAPHQGTEQIPDDEQTPEVYTIPNNVDTRELNITADDYEKLEATIENGELNPQVSALAEETRMRAIEGFQLEFEPTERSSEQAALGDKTLDQFLTSIENVLTGEGVHYTNGNEEDFWKLAFESYGDEYALASKDAGVSYEEYMASFDDDNWGAKQYVSDRLIQDAYANPILEQLKWTGDSYTINVYGDVPSINESFSYNVIHQTIAARTYSELSDEYTDDSPIVIERLNNAEAYFLTDYPTFAREDIQFDVPSSNPQTFTLGIEFGAGNASDVATIASLEKLQ